MIHLTIDGKEISVPKGTTVYQAAKLMGVEIPIFCYQDRMPPFGACRMCLVEVEKMNKPQTSCTLEATEGMVVKTQSSTAVEAREGILELLLINHPLDCPICDRGGECPLQDQTLKHGPGESRFFEEKRRFVKPLPLGPVLMLDRERCIVCARCTRFGELVAGDHALEMKERGFKTEVGTPDNLLAESKFIGNTISLCPVGALTSQVYRFRARPWDNDPSPSTCTLCPVGCSLTLDSRDGEIVRTRSRENRAVNDIWLCDKGWFGYEYVANPGRLDRPLIRKAGELQPASWEEALACVASQMQRAQSSQKIAGMGGNPLTTEENYLFQELIRKGAGVNHVDHRVGMPVMNLDDEELAPGMEQSIGECESLSFAVLLGIDLTEEFPVMWLRLKQAINRGAKVLFIGNFAPEIARHLTKTVVHAPGREMEVLSQHFSTFHEWAQGDKRGAIFVGSQYLANPNRAAILSRLLNIRESYAHVSLNILEGKGNSMGARLAGMRPDLGPLGVKIPNPGLNAVQILETAAASGWDFLYVAGANPVKHYPDKLWQSARQNTGFLVVQDLFLTETASQADVVLPTLSSLEKAGSFMNIEHRIQPLHPGKEIPPDRYSDAAIFLAIAERLGLYLTFSPAFSAFMKQTHVATQYRQKRDTKAFNQLSSGLKAVFAPALFDHGIRMKHAPHLIQLAKAPCLRLHPKEAERKGLTSGDRVRLSANGRSIQAEIQCDLQVAEETVVIPLGFDQIPAYELGSNLLNGMPIDIQKEV